MIMTWSPNTLYNFMQTNWLLAYSVWQIKIFYNFQSSLHLNIVICVMQFVFMFCEKRYRSRVGWEKSRKKKSPRKQYHFVHKLLHGVERLNFPLKMQLHEKCVRVWGRQRERESATEKSMNSKCSAVCTVGCPKR